MSNYGRAANDLYRLTTQQITPAGVSKRVACETCKKVKSLGQFPKGEQNICITCKPQPAGWRRGDL